MSVYLKYAVKKDLDSEILSESKSNIIIKITGKKAYSLFRSEIGKHSVQRVPPTETKGRRHTSMISVSVLKLEETDHSINEADVEIKTQGGKGPGGQHQNSTDSAVRAHHKPTGIKVFINGRKQSDNKKEAMAILSAKVSEYYETKKEDEVGQKRKNQMGGSGRGNKIRTYNFIDCRIVNHKTETKTSKIKEFMRGDLDVIK